MIDIKLDMGQKGSSEAFFQQLSSAEGTLTIGIDRSIMISDGGKQRVPAWQVAIYNEFGTKKAPARPAVTAALIKNRQFIRNSLRTRAQMIARGETTAKKTMLRLGDKIVDKILLSYETFNTPANAESTIRAKGFNNPLIWSKTLSRAWRATWVPNTSASAKKMISIGKMLDKRGLK